MMVTATRITIVTTTYFPISIHSCLRLVLWKEGQRTIMETLEVELAFRPFLLVRGSSIFRASLPVRAPCHRDNGI